MPRNPYRFFLYINQLFQIITSLALDNLSEFELVTIVITG